MRLFSSLASFTMVFSLRRRKVRSVARSTWVCVSFFRAASPDSSTPKSNRTVRGLVDGTTFFVEAWLLGTLLVGSGDGDLGLLAAIPNSSVEESHPLLYSALPLRSGWWSSSSKS